MHRAIGLLCGLGLAASGLVGRATAQAAAPPKPLVMTAENLMAGDERHRENPSAALPGDVIRYRLTFTNPRPDSIRNVQFHDPIPPGLHYVGGSAAADRDDVTIEFSIDGGRSWSPQPMTEEMVNGQKVRRAAPPSQYTNVRWTVHGWVKSHAQVTAELRAQLGEGGPRQ